MNRRERLTTDGRERLGMLFFVASGIAALLALSAAVTGGFRVHLLGIPISARGEHRAALVACLLAAAGLALHRGVRARVTAACLAAWRLLLAVRVPPAPVAVALSLAMLGLGLMYGTKAAAGSDAYGYVSQFPLWLEGNLREYQPLAASVPWPNADWTFSPLGYAPGGGHTIVPVYAPGIPLLMALFVSIFGAGAEYWVTPLSGAVLVLFTYLIGSRFSRPAVGLAAAAMAAASPVVRPNLAPLALFVPLVTLAVARGSDYADLGALVDRMLPPDAIILSMQHSGSLRYHGRRTTILYEFLPAEWLDRAVEHLEDEGYPVYVILDNEERQYFLEMFEGAASLRCIRDPLPAGLPFRAHIHRLHASGC